MSNRSIQTMKKTLFVFVLFLLSVNVAYPKIWVLLDTKMIGGVQLYVWDKARELDFAKELKSSGIEKALVLWDANHTPYPEIGYDNKLKELGYATGGYELFTDIHLRDTVFSEFDSNGPLRFAHTVYPGKFQYAARPKDGRTYFNQFGHTSCPLAIRPEIYRKVGNKLKEYLHETLFLTSLLPKTIKSRSQFFLPEKRSW